MARPAPDGEHLIMALSAEERLARLEARAEIGDLVARYAHGADRGNDPAIMRTLFTPDATWSAAGFAALEGREAITKGLADIAASRVLWSIHFMVSPHIVLSPGGRSARCHWYLWELCTMAGDAGQRDEWLGGWYDSEAEWTEDGWKFSSVRLEIRLQGEANPPWYLKQPVAR